MKKRLVTTVFVITLTAVGIIVLTTKDVGKKEEIPDYGYQAVEETDIFETGVMEGELTTAPLNPEFMEFGELPDDPKILRKTLVSDSGKGLGIIPSPIAVEIHKAPMKKTVGVSQLETTYDLRDPDGDGDNSDSFLPPARNQGECGACWAFATYGGTESILSENYGYIADFSENNVLYRTGYDWGECTGGNVDMSMAYHARNAGPVYESSDPFAWNSTDYCIDCKPVRYIDSMVKLPVRANTHDNDYIKEMLKRYGPLYASMHWSDKAYDATNHTYYYKGYRTNHAVTIIGWDDEKQVTGAPDPGAYIVRNSWGESWGDNGYFYISYYDRSFAFASLAAFDDRPDALLSFDRIYYHDKLGMTSSTGFGKAPAWGGNVFVPEKDGAIVAIGLFTTFSETNYEIHIYETYTGASFAGVIGGPYAGSLTGRGYHTILLDQGVDVVEGDDFSVVVKFETPNYNWPVPLEKPFPGYSSGADASPGESYISSDGVTWTDVTSVYPGTNVCIKAFVLERECSAGSISVEGPGDEGIFVVDKDTGSHVLAVVTDGCGTPIQDADVVAELNTGTDLALYDDGNHNDFNPDDGIYGNEVAQKSPALSSGLVISASKDGNSGSTVSEEVKTAAAATGKGCFLEVVY